MTEETTRYSYEPVSGTELRNVHPSNVPVWVPPRIPAGALLYSMSNHVPFVRR